MSWFQCQQKLIGFKILYDLTKLGRELLINYLARAIASQAGFGSHVPRTPWRQANHGRTFFFFGCNCLTLMGSKQIYKSSARRAMTNEVHVRRQQTECLGCALANFYRTKKNPMRTRSARSWIWLIPDTLVAPFATIASANFDMSKECHGNVFKHCLDLDLAKHPYANANP